MSAALAAYRAALRTHWQAVAEMHAREGTKATAAHFGLSRQRIQQLVQRWRAEQAKCDLETATYRDGVPVNLADEEVREVWSRAIEQETKEGRE